MTLMQRRRALMAVKSGTAHGTWEDLFYHIDKGDYATAYSVGEILPLDLGTAGVVNAQIIAFNADMDGTKSVYRPVTMIAQYACTNTRRMAPQLSGSSGNRTPGTGCIGGWEYSEMRSYLATTIKSLLPSAVASRLASCVKYSRIYNSAEEAVNNAETVDELWIPSNREINGGGSYETVGPVYSYFQSASQRIKTTPSGESASWWTRSAFHSANYRYVRGSDGAMLNANSAKTNAILIGFCIA